MENNHLVSIIISTYNQPNWLHKVLYGYENQSYKNFEVIIADDGSTQETKELILKFIKKSILKIKHVWHEDLGFRKTIILNKAILEAQGEYLIFTDGDCIPREDFVEKHVQKRKIGKFLSGGYFKLPMNISEHIKDEDILYKTCFDLKWLKSHGLKSSFKNNKLTSKGYKENFLNFITPTKATWNGMNSSGWKKDILAVNGFDERMHYGAEDREMGSRLINHGIKGMQIRYSAICIHLDHARGYINQERIKENLKIWKKTEKEKLTWTDYGIKKNL